MRRIGRVVVLGLVAGTLVGVPRLAQAGSGAGTLEGTRWKVRAVPDDAARRRGEKPSSDTLIFQEGKMISTGCARFGFSPSTYTVSPVGSASTFSAQQMSLKEGQTAWTGQVNGETIKGTMVWARKDDTRLRYTFEGKRARPFWSRVSHWFSRNRS